jgi:hypothetical protein
MSKKVLSVIDTAYRATQEEQDDAGLWMTAAAKNAGVEDVTVLLTGNAVNYAVKGGGSVPHPFDAAGDIQRMADKGIEFFLIREDAEERGINPDTMLSCVEAISRSQLAGFVDGYDSIWHW